MHGSAVASDDRAGVSEPAVDPRTPQKPLRICMIHYSDFTLDSRVQRHAYAAAERGDEIDAICLSAPSEIRVGRGVVRLHQVCREKTRAAPWTQLGAYARFCLGAAVRVQALQHLQRFDVVEAHNMPDAIALAALPARLRGTPIILDVHDTFPELFQTKFGRRGAPLVPLVRLEERISAGASSAVICVTQEARERLATRSVSLGKSHVVMNAPDEGVFGPQRRPVMIPKTGAVRVVYHGGIVHRFGVEPLIRAFALLQESAERVRLDVHGSFDNSGELDRLLTDLSPKRVFLAQAPTPFLQIPSVLSDKHIGIVPTLPDEFTELLLPVKLLEYVHMGIPVITSRLPAIENYFSDREVRFVKPVTPESIAEAVLELCADPQAAADRAARASERLLEMRWSRQRQQYLAVIDRVASRPRGRGR